MLTFTGRARVLPDAVNTDYIISSSRKRQIRDMDRLKQYVFEDLPGLPGGSIEPGDILVAGYDFGCGSAMEIAVDVLVASEVGCILARSSARTFYRNATNAGLALIIWEGGCVAEGDKLTVKYAQEPVVRNESKNAALQCSKVPGFITLVVQAGGLIHYVNSCGMPPRGCLQ